MSGKVFLLLTAAAIACSSIGLAQPAKIPPSQLYGSWMFSCDDGVCKVFLSLADEKTKEAKITWTFVHDPKTSRISTILQVPVLVALPPGVRVYADEKTHYTWPFQFCDPSSCRAITVVAEDVFSSLKRRDKATIQYIQYGQAKPTSYTIPMDGLAAATDRLIAEAKKSK